MSSPEVALKSGLASLHASEEFSDFIITCGPYSFRVHKAIISSQSDYFRRACRQGFKEGETNHITLETTESDPTCGDDPEAVKCMVHYFYHLDYQAPNTTIDKDDAASGDPTMQGMFSAPQNSSAARDRAAKAQKMTAAVQTNFSQLNNGSTLDDAGALNIVVHAQVFAAATKYQISALRALAVQKYTTGVNLNCSHKSFAESIEVIYNTTPEEARELRDIVENTLDSNSSLLDSKEVEEVVCSINGLSYQLFKKARRARAKPSTPAPSKIPSAPCTPAAEPRSLPTNRCRRCFELSLTYGSAQSCYSCASARRIS